MRRLLWACAFILLSAAAASAQGNCIVVNGVSQCASPWRIYDSTVRAISFPILDLSQTWNAPGVTFTGLKQNVTDTNSATASLLMDLQVGGTSKFSVSKAGLVTAVGMTSTGLFKIPAGTVAAPSLAFSTTPTTGVYERTSGTWNVGIAGNNTLEVAAALVTIGNGAATSMTGKVSTYNNVTTAGWGLDAVQGQATTGTVTNTGTASIATYTVGAADGVFRVSCDVSVTVSTTHSFSCDVTYTDVTSAARTLVLPMYTTAGAQLASNLIAASATGSFNSPVMQIRAKAATVITVRTSSGGTFTTVTYTASGSITQIG